ncbi:ABC transporter family substrate-binding protein [Streptomyces sp. MUM 178J]|uniref:ABC transporter family substrate-binding protein n=1 Tax=Streptomyces sp. MUM 178J TaxID=2791991 RepID=UPI001F035A19|nr:ABC transporter family substrate-binding protein [Streptomyces sp. MUM 178J]WRQ81496.1 ABC transporter family substrate-binding protein [Streptomyces sp. MUM 178J]
MSRTLRSLALLTSVALALPGLTGCSTDEAGGGAPAAPQDIAPVARQLVADGGTLRWAVDSTPATLNAFQADADATTTRIAQAVLPALFTLDRRGRPQRNPDYLESAEIVEREPKQVVLYKLNQQAVWSDGREIGAADFVAQWRALNGKNTAYWTARNAGYERIEKIERGANDLEVRVTFAKPYADWRSLFTPLYPKDVTGKPSAFNDGARGKLKVMAGPFQLKGVDRKAGATTLVRNPRWWGDQAKLEKLVLTEVERDKRAEALADGRVDLAEIDRKTADRIVLAARDAADAAKAGAQLGHGPAAELTASSALMSWALANGSNEEKAQAARQAREQTAAAVAKYAAEQKSLSGYEVRKSLEPAFTQLAMNGESGPLADARVRRAVARALDRRELAETVLTPLGLPAEPVGSHLALAGQRAYTDNSETLGGQDTQEAQALLADAGWTPGGAVEKEAPAKAGNEAEAQKKKDEEKATGGEEEKGSGGAQKDEAKDEAKDEKKDGEDRASDEGLYIVGDGKPGDLARAADADATRFLVPAPGAALQGLALQRRALSLGLADPDGESRPQQSGVAGAYAPLGTAAPAQAPSEKPSAQAGGPLGKDGKPLSLRFVLPSGPGSEPLRAVGEKIAGMLDRIGIQTEIAKVSDDSYFKDHIASGDYDLALYSWPATAYPATDARPIYAKPQPAADGSLLVEQNYTRVGTDYIDQLFAQAAAELDEDAALDLVRRADARIWAAAGSIPLYQRPELVAAKPKVANAGAFGFATPRYQDIGFTKTAAKRISDEQGRGGQDGDGQDSGEDAGDGKMSDKK